MAILLLLLILLEYFRNRGEGCGIPVIFWIEIFFVILLTKSIFDLNVIWVMRVSYRMRMPFFITSWIIFTTGLAAWTVYGYFLYFSDRNDC
mmetsp:Transcript_4457/g.6602  ORF Transcript_4457/g.6602 Transcript_4457/m.6602 type:complete len:91 (-) Transcript_4457:501-773(-)